MLQREEMCFTGYYRVNGSRLDSPVIWPDDADAQACRRPASCDRSDRDPRAVAAATRDNRVDCWQRRVHLRPRPMMTNTFVICSPAAAAAAVA